jgi:hypothetical protein
MMVKDENRVVSILGSRGLPQVVPDLAAVVTAEDEDGYTYDAEVETLLPDRRVYLRVDWTSRRRAQDITDGFPINFRSVISLPETKQSQSL